LIAPQRLTATGGRLQSPRPSPRAQRSSPQGPTAVPSHPLQQAATMAEQKLTVGFMGMGIMGVSRRGPRPGAR
jgi:hypothetical protein